MSDALTVVSSGNAIEMSSLSLFLSLSFISSLYVTVPWVFATQNGAMILPLVFTSTPGQAFIVVLSSLIVIAPWIDTYYVYKHISFLNIGDYLLNSY